MEIYTSVHISCMCYISYLKLTRWLQYDVRDGLFAHSVGNDAEWFENCMMFYFINFVDQNDVFGKEFICLRCYLDSK